MRVALFANGWVGWQIAELLAESEDIVALIVHPDEKARDRDAIIEACSFAERDVVFGNELRDPAVAQRVIDAGADIGVSANFGFILKPNVFGSFPSGCINVHSGFLPYNRGANPNVWSIVDSTPAGSTLHYIDEGVDTGDIVAQRRVEVTPTETGASLYEKLQQASVDLFKETWPSIKDGTVTRTPQDPSAGTVHRVVDMKALDEIDVDEVTDPRRLADIVRARTFPGYPGTTLKLKGRSVSIDEALRYVSEKHA